jgi:hypothetical protein
MVVAAQGEIRVKCSSSAATVRLIVCSLALTAFFSTGHVAHATSSGDPTCDGRAGCCREDADCGAREYCGSDAKCRMHPSCDDQNGCTIDTHEGKGKCSHIRVEGCQTGSDDRNVRGNVGANDARTRGRMRIRANVAKAGLTVIEPITEDVSLQIRPAGSRDFLCASVPTAKFLARRRNAK